MPLADYEKPLSPSSVKRQITADESVDSDHPALRFPSLEQGHEKEQVATRDNTTNSNTSNNNEGASKQSRKKTLGILVLIVLPILAALAIWVGISQSSSSKQLEANDDASLSTNTTHRDNNCTTPGRIESATTSPLANLNSTMNPTVAARTQVPTLYPSSTMAPSVEPSFTIQPTVNPSTAPTTLAPVTTLFPSNLPSTNPTIESPIVTTTTTFYVIGDVPYNDQQAAELAIQMDNIPTSAAFVVHVGDIRSAADESQRCTRQEYQSVASILQRSAVPVLLIPGDNEWNDCSNPSQAWNIWLEVFVGFESQSPWDDNNNNNNNPFAKDDLIVRMPDRPETFSFVHEGTLFVGLNLVGGQILDASEWETRLTDQVLWLQELMRDQHYGKPTVVFGHANPVNNHDAFFLPLRDFVRDELQNEVPLIYINGDKHSWEFNETFYNQPNWQRIMVSGGTTDPPLKVQAHAGVEIQNVSQAFSYDRQLP